jgi:glycosyltransferase involved in cell wall biosynthesis
MNKVRSPLHILFLASWYPNRLEPQNGNFIRRHAQAVALKAKVAALHVISDPSKSTSEISKSWKDGVYEVVVYFPKSNTWNPLKKLSNYLKAHRKGYEAIIAELDHIDLVHLNVFFRAGLFALELKKKHQIPYIVTEHLTAFLDSNPYKFKGYEKYFIRKIARAASLICPVSEDLRRALERFGIKGPFEVVPNVVNTKLFQNNKDRDYSKIRLLHVSTLNEAHKNFSGMLRVIKRLSKIRQDFVMTFVGNNFGVASIEKAKDLDLLNTFVRIQDEIPIQDIAALMREYHIFILFSNYENLPCVISEAHASGMIVLATDVGGVREMINKNNGSLISAGDEDALLTKLIEIMDHLVDYNITTISKEAVNRYSYEHVGQKFIDLYQGILSKN